MATSTFDKDRHEGFKPAGTDLSIRVMVVEDSPLLASDLDEILSQAGCAVVGPAHSLEAARTLAQADPPDAALLDVQVGGSSVFGLAAELRERDTRVVFYTGHDPAMVIPREHLDCLCLVKPATEKQILAALGVNHEQG